LGVELAVKVMLVSGYFTFRPHASFCENGAANPTGKDYWLHGGFFAAYRVRTWERRLDRERMSRPCL
jgi:hypothetical protein